MLRRRYVNHLFPYLGRTLVSDLASSSGDALRDLVQSEPFITLFRPLRAPKVSTASNGAKTIIASAINPKYAMP